MHKLQVNTEEHGVKTAGLWLSYFLGKVGKILWGKGRKQSMGLGKYLCQLHFQVSKLRLFIRKKDDIYRMFPA